MSKKQENLFTNPALITISIITGLLLLWYKVTTAPMEKLLILFIMFTVIFPMSAGIMNILVMSAIPKSKGSNYSNKSTKRRTTIQKKQVNTYDKRVNPNYTALRETVIAFARNGQLRQNDLDSLTDFVDCKLNERGVDDSKTYQNSKHSFYS